MKLRSSELVGFVIVALVSGFVAGSMVAEQTRTVELPSPVGVVDGTISEAKTKLVAVTREGKGLVTDVSVRTVPGKGGILVDIDNLLFFVDTQHSIQLAKEVAEDYLNITLSDRDLVYSIEVNNTTVVGGESAGGALAVATIAAISGNQLRNDTVMTGTINPDGTIGAVGGLVEKAKAAREAGYNFFLVPKGQGTSTYVQKEQECSKIGRTTVCKTIFKPLRVSIGNETGITVVEVSTIEDIVHHFLPDY